MHRAAARSLRAAAAASVASVAATPVRCASAVAPCASARFIHSRASLLVDPADRAISAFLRPAADGRPKRVLGVETSCDDTALAIVDTNGRLLSHASASQWQQFEQFAGIQPRAAAAAHTSAIDPVFAQVLSGAGLNESDIDGVAVTAGPGMGICLQVGLEWASTLARRLSLPMIGVHHMQAHAHVVEMDHPQLQYPFLALLISGGHTELWLVRAQSECVILSETADDAVGEAYDKVARAIGVVRLEGESPGAAVERMARQATHASRFSFPLLKHDNTEFSFAGLKAAVQRVVLQLRADMAPSEAAHDDSGSSSSKEGAGRLRRTPAGHLSNATISTLMKELRDQQGLVKQAVYIPASDSLLALLPELPDETKADLCAAFETSVCHQLTTRTLLAIHNAKLLQSERSMAPVTQLVVGGGVACNGTIQAALRQTCEAHGISVLSPRRLHCMDNGIMVAFLGQKMLQQGHSDPYDLLFHSRWPIGPKHAMQLPAPASASKPTR